MSALLIPPVNMNRRSISSQLESSMRQLDNKLISSGKNLLRTSRRSVIPQTGNLDFSMHGDDSFGMDSFLVQSSKLNQSDFNNVSVTMFTTEVDDLHEKFNSTQVVSSLIKGKEPWQAVSDRLFLEFLETIQSRGLEQLFDTLSDLIQTCSDTLDLIKKIRVKSSVVPRSKPSSWWLENERNAWRLVYCLYQNRLSKRDDSDEMDTDGVSCVISEKETISKFYKDSNSTYECQLIIDWLEKNAQDQMYIEGPRPEYFTDKTIAWENTLHQLQNKRDQIPYGSSRSIVESMDPDAPLREGKPLHDIDKEDEDRLMKQVFQEIRCGRLERAQALCVHCGQPWRAATLEGWKLHHDPNYNRPVNDGEKLAAQGNPKRDIWKSCVWNMASDKRKNPYERAAYGALCGNVTAVLPVCGTWYDQLWARLRALVDLRVEQEIRSTVAKSYVNMPPEYWQNNSSMKDIFMELSSSGDASVRGEAVQPYHVVQQLLILDEIPALMIEMRGWLNKDPQFIRFLAHLVLVLRQVGQSHHDDIGDAVLEAYVKLLMSQGNPRLVAHYVCTLPPDTQVRWYTCYLAEVKETSERAACLQAAEEAGLDVTAITKAVVEFVRHKALSSSLPDLKADVSEADLDKISALDWVVYYPSQRAEALWQSNALIRHFLALGKVEAARKALNKVPGDSIGLVIKQHNISTRDFSNSSSPRSTAAVREHLCHRAYLDAQESFSDWFEHFHNAKPKPPVKPAAGEGTFTERVAFDHRKKLYDADLERWKVAMNIQTKLVKQRLYNVLLFPDGGWLEDGVVDNVASLLDHSVEEKGRLQQMSNLRQICIPAVVLLIHSVMHSMEEYTECVQLADIVVSEQHQLYKVYSKVKMADLLRKICESSILLMDQKKDAWGNPI